MFKVPSKGHVLDAVVLEDSSIYLLSTDPMCLIGVDGGHRVARTMDLYEYFPLIGSSTEWADLIGGGRKGEYGLYMDYW